MAKYTPKQALVVEAITFEEFIEFGRKNATSIVNGIPWSFKYKGIPITHHSDDCYLMCLPDGQFEVTAKDVIVTDNVGTHPLPADFFYSLYDEVVDNDFVKSISPS